MKKRIIDNIIIVVCVIGILGIFCESGYSVGKQRTTAYYENYQSERDAVIESMLNGTNDFFGEITERADRFLEAAHS